MPYTMQIFKGELDEYPIPDIGDTFVVTGVTENVLDFHWGRCTHIVLQPLESTESNQFGDLTNFQKCDIMVL